jgi:asparagine synthase (glutamine-hydrolysing)
LPGIAGIVDLKGKLNLRERITGMLHVMKHEPWYKLGQFQQTPVALGRASLGIIDPQDQPVFNRDRSLCMVMCGEVYHYPEDALGVLKKSHPSEPSNHASSILMLIDAHGIDIVKKLNGSFTLALWDFRERRLIIANDRYGLRPLYYLRQEDLLLFASEMKSILTLPQVKREIDLRGMTEFFSFGFVMQDRTLFQQIKVLRPASILVFQEGTLQIRSYWNLDLREDPGKFDKEGSLERAHFLLKQAVRRQLEDGVPKVLSLSGGLDSRTLLGAAVQSGHRIPSFTFGTRDCPDQKLAKAAADSLGTENRFFELSPDFLEVWAKRGVWLTEGMNNCVNFHGMEFTPEIRRQALVVLNGFMGGELFGFLSLSSARLLFQKGSKGWIEGAFRLANHPFADSELAGLFQPKHYSQMRDLPFPSFKESMGACPFDSPFNKSYWFRFREQAPKSFLYGLLLDNDLVEYRAPFCDYDLVDFVSSVPPKQKMLAIFHRRLLTEKFPPLGSIPYQRTGLPVSSGLTRILLRKAKDNLKKRVLRSGVDRRGYLDYDRWMRQELRDFLTATLLGDRSLSRGYFNPDYVKRTVEDHISGRRNLSSQLGALLTFELWNQLFLDSGKNLSPGCV